MSACKKCSDIYKKPCEQLNYLDVANNCTDLKKFVNEIRTKAIKECVKFVDDWDSVIADALAKKLNERE